jgi:hypothetical protein
MRGSERKAWADYLEKIDRQAGPHATALAVRAREKLNPGAFKPPRERSALLVKLAGNLDVMGVPYLYEFHADNIGADGLEKGWRFDLCILPLELRLLVEIHGALGSGKHSRKVGQTNDLDKANAATEHGWSVLSYGASQIHSGAAALQIERLVRLRGRDLGLGRQ